MLGGNWCAGGGYRGVAGWRRRPWLGPDRPAEPWTRATQQHVNHQHVNHLDDNRLHDNLRQHDVDDNDQPDDHGADDDQRPVR